MYAEGIRNSATMAQSLVRDVDPSNELEYIRIGTKKVEMMAHLGNCKILNINHTYHVIINVNHMNYESQITL